MHDALLCAEDGALDHVSPECQLHVSKNTSTHHMWLNVLLMSVLRMSSLSWPQWGTLLVSPRLGWTHALQPQDA